MRRFAKRLLMILCTIALVGGSTISFAASVTAVDGCNHATAHAGDHAKAHAGGVPLHHHDDHGVLCVARCAGAVVGDLPTHPMLNAAAFSVAAVTYWQTEISLSNRSIAPDPDPPRTSA